MATIGKTLFAHFRQVLHASAQYDQAITVFHRLKKRLEVSNLCSLSWDQTVTFSDLAHGPFQRRHARQQGSIQRYVRKNKKASFQRSRLSGCTSNFWKRHGGERRRVSEQAKRKWTKSFAALAKSLPAWPSSPRADHVRRMRTMDVVEHLISGGSIDPDMDVYQQIRACPNEMRNERARLLLDFIALQTQAFFWEFQAALTDTGCGYLAVRQDDEQMLAQAVSVQELSLVSVDEDDCPQSRCGEAGVQAEETLQSGGNTSTWRGGWLSTGIFGRDQSDHLFAERRQDGCSVRVSCAKTAVCSQRFKHESSICCEFGRRLWERRERSAQPTTSGNGHRRFRQDHGVYKRILLTKARRKDVQKSSDISVYNTINREEVRGIWSRRWYIILAFFLVCA